MSTKPTDAPTWASDATFDAGAEPYAGEPTKAEPVADRKEQGFEPGVEPFAEEVNWMLWALCQWTTWLNDGDVEFANIYHGEMCLPIGIETAVGTGGSVAKTFTGTSDGDYLEATGSSEMRYPIIGLKLGDRILRVDVELYGSASGTAGLSVGGQRVDGVTSGAREVFVAPANNGASPPGGGSTGAFVTTTDTIGTLWAKRQHQLGAAGVGYVIGEGGDNTEEETVYVNISTPTGWRTGNVFVYFDRPRP